MNQPPNVGYWVTGAYTESDGTRFYAMAIHGRPTPTLWQRIVMRVQGWIWLPGPMPAMGTPIAIKTEA